MADASRIELSDEVSLGEIVMFVATRPLNTANPITVGLNGEAPRIIRPGGAIQVHGIIIKPIQAPKVPTVIDVVGGRHRNVAFGSLIGTPGCPQEPRTRYIGDPVIDRTDAKIAGMRVGEIVTFHQYLRLLASIDQQGGLDIVTLSFDLVPEAALLFVGVYHAEGDRLAA